LTFKNCGKESTTVCFIYFTLTQGYWLADRQKYQDETATFIAEMIHHLTEENVFLYLATFYENMMENFRHLDKHR
jgi:hypothetical protein